MSVSGTENVTPSYFGASSGTSATSSSTGSSTTDNTTSQMDKDLFLKLMVAQLRNQDPMNPTDSSQFLAQTAQFTSLEKLSTVADQTTQGLNAQMAFGASGLVGRAVTYTDADGAQASGTVGSVTFTSAGPMLGIGDQQVALSALVQVTSK